MSKIRTRDLQLCSPACYLRATGDVAGKPLFRWKYKQTLFVSIYKIVWKNTSLEAKDRHSCFTCVENYDLKMFAKCSFGQILIKEEINYFPTFVQDSGGFIHYVKIFC